MFHRDEAEQLLVEPDQQKRRTEGAAAALVAATAAHPMPARTEGQSMEDWEESTCFYLLDHLVGFSVCDHMFATRACAYRTFRDMRDKDGRIR